MALPEWQKSIWRYVRRVLHELDEFANVILGGKEDETLSFRSAVAMKNGSKFACIFCKFLNLFEKDHCQKSYDKHMGDSSSDQGQ